MIKRFFQDLFADHSEKGIVEKVYEALQPYESVYQQLGVNFSYRRTAPEDLLLKVFALSRDVETTAHLIRIIQQRDYVIGFRKRVSAEVFVQEAGQKAAEEAEGFYESGKGFCDEILSLAERGAISAKPEVGQFLKENLTCIMIEWGDFRSEVNFHLGDN